MLRGLARLFAVLCILLAAGAVAVGVVAYLWRSPGPAGEERVVAIERGMGVRAIAARLEEEGVVENRWLFLAGLHLPGVDRNLRFGEYLFPAGASMAEVAAMMAEGRTLAYRITIPEGLTSREVVELLESRPELDCVVAEIPPEGSLLPETYQFERGDSCAGLLERMRQAMSATVAELWEGRAAGLPLDTAEEAVILASIVEKETGLAAERPIVASVFVNRLEQGMPLQSDPTVIYAITEGRGRLGRELLRSDWQVDSPYNTYRNAGLPPGPIANPGRDAIAAVLDPARTDFLYFVASGDGGHAFARSLEEHNRNVEAWRRIRDGGGQ